MRVETQVELLRRFVELRRDRTTTLAPHAYRQPASVYTDPERAEKELHAVLRGQPTLVALSCDVPDPGSTFATEALGVPLLIVRGEDGVARGLLNICRHRGGRVACGRGKPGRSLRCPYHSWTYDLDGRLLGQPMSRHGFDELDRDELGLKPIPVDERFGLLFARIDGGHVDVAAELGAFGPELGDFDLRGFVPYAERSRVFGANWKLLYDTFMESYHIFSLHKDSLADKLLSAPLVLDMAGRHARAVIVGQKVDRVLEREESEWDLRRNATIVYALFPSGLLNFTPSGHLDRWLIEPEGDDPNRSRATLAMYVPADRAHQKDLWETNLKLTERAVYGEDFTQQEEIQRGLRTGLVDEMQFGRNEPNLIAQHEAIQALVNS